MTCVFFGHRRTPDNILPRLRNIIKELIEKEGCGRFYVGDSGEFDRMVYSELKKLSKVYPHISINVVLAYMPVAPSEYNRLDYNDTIYPDGLETVPKKFAIVHRNRWMVKKADMAVCYLNSSIGGAAAAVKSIYKKGKTVINLSGVDLDELFN